jgi:hypothetical protein
MSEPVSNTEHEPSSLNQQNGPTPSEASPLHGLPTLETAEPQAEQQVQAASSELFYTQEDGDKFDFSHPLVDDSDAPFVLPFQLSSEMEPVSSVHTKTIHAQTASTPDTPNAVAPSIKARLTLRMVKYLLIASVVLVTLVGASLLVFAQSSQPKPSLPGTAPTQVTQATRGTRARGPVQMAVTRSTGTLRRTTKGRGPVQ